jgi:hypothetical protein
VTWSPNKLWRSTSSIFSHFPKTDPDSTYHPDAADLDSDFLFDAGPTFHPDADPDPSFKKMAQTLGKVLK